MKTKRLSFDVDFYTPESPEQCLYAGVLNTYFVDINNLADTKNWRYTNLPEIIIGHNKSWNIESLSLEKMKHYLYSETTKLYCELLDVSYDWFIKLFDNYLDYKLGIRLNEI